MFILTTIKDTIQIKPHQFVGDYHERLISVINNRFANKVIPNVGLGINLYDFLEVGQSHILPGEGCTYTEVKFRLVIFRPFIGQILEGVVLKCTREGGLFISLDFFDDVQIPPTRLPENSKFDVDEQSWYWLYQADEGDEETKLFMDPGKRVRFRIVGEQFNDVQPGEENKEDVKAYQLEGSMSENGLGCMLWWLTQEVEVDEEEEEAEGEETEEDGQMEVS